MELLMHALMAIPQMLMDDIYSVAVVAPPSSYDASLAYGCQAFATVYQQGPCGACMAFAVASAYAMRSCKQGHNATPSPYWIFDCASLNGCEDGSTLYHMDRVMQGGVGGIDESAPHFGLRCVQGQHKADTYVVIGQNSIKWDLMRNGPLTYAVWSTPAFADHKKGDIYMGDIDNPDGSYHEVVVYGWQDATGGESGSWLIINSWGSDWGDNGRGRIMYDAIDSMFAFIPLT
jgi:Papain family cysteine protease